MIADEIVIPKEQRKHYTEKIILLPHTYQPNDNRGKSQKQKQRAQILACRSTVLYSVVSTIATR